MQSRTRNGNPAFFLLVLAPGLGELLSGSSPPLEFFNPVALVAFLALYGGGAVIARELVRRWDKGWASLLVLGVAFAIVNEGLSAKSFFDPNFGDLGSLKHYGRALGVNWIWTEQLIIYHVVVSIAIPITLAELIFPERRFEPWTGPAVFNSLVVLLVADTALLYESGPYKPPLLLALVALLAVVGLCLLARLLPKKLFTTTRRCVAKPSTLFLIGLFAFAFYFIVLGEELPRDSVPPLVTAFVVAAFVALVAFTLTRLDIGSSSDIQRLSLASGVLAFFIVLGLIEEALGVLGMGVVAAAAAILLLKLRRRLFLRTPGGA